MKTPATFDATMSGYAHSSQGSAGTRAYGYGARGVRVSAPKTGRWALVGQGALADAVAAAWPYQDISLVQWPAYDRDAPLVDGVIEVVGGVSPALDVCLTALARGVPVATANPLLLAAHGRVISAAARNAGIGVEGALLGSIAVGPMLPWARDMVLCLGGAADRVLQRMCYRGESAEQAEAALRHQGLEDMAGKQVVARAVALHGQWTHAWLSPAEVKRRPVDCVSVADVRVLQAQGLKVRFGAVLRAGEIYVGPLAVADGLLAPEGATLVAQTTAGQQVMQAQGNEIGRAVCGLMQDVARLRSGQTAAEMPAVVAGRGTEALWYVRREGEGQGILTAEPLAGEAVVRLPVVGDVSGVVGLRRVA